MVTIVAFGDSITQGVYLQPECAWPSVMARLSGHHVYNAGVGGNTTQHALHRFERDVLARQPHVVVFEFGMNDHVFTAHGEHRVTPTDFQANLARMAQTCIGIQAQVLFCLLHAVVAEYYYERHPSTWYPYGVEAELDLYNQCIQAVAHTLESPFIDIPLAFTKDDPAYTTPASRLLRSEMNSKARDGVHLSEEGASLYAETVWQTLSGLLP